MPFPSTYTRAARRPVVGGGVAGSEAG